MNRPPLDHPSGSDPEFDALLGAYALDAIDPDERARVDEYLAGNPTARDEVDELRESAASLALAPMRDVSASPELWHRISSSIADEPRVITALPTRERRIFSPRVVMGLAAAIALVVLAAGVLVVQGRNSKGSSDLATVFDKAASQHGARQIALAPANGVEVARIVLLPDGSGYLKNDGMNALPSDLTYQLWALSGSKDQPIAISAGVLGGSPRTVAFHTSSDVHGFGLTVEHTPGVVSSTQPMYATATVT